MKNAKSITTKIFSVLIAIVMSVSTLPFIALANDDASEYVYISISDDQYFISDENGAPLAFTKIDISELETVNLSDYGLDYFTYDADGDGSPDTTALHLYIYVHEQILGLDWSSVTVTGGAGSAYFAGGLFGFSDENLRYDLNGAYPSVDGWGLTADQIVLSDGDFINVAHYSSWAFWGDSTTGFHYFADSAGALTSTFTISEGEVARLTLVRSFSDWTNGGASAFAPEENYTVYYGKAYGEAEGSVSTDDDGSISLPALSEGIWYVWADGGFGAENPADIVSAPAFATIIVEENKDVALAKEVSDKIDAIGTVTVFSANKISAARSLYNDLNDKQKQYVDNYATLTDAESKLAELYLEAADADHKAIYEATQNFLSTLGTPCVGSVGGEWMVIDITRAGYPCPEGYYDNVVEYVNSTINAKEQLHRSKSTENSRIILALTSAGYDVTNVNDHNLLMGLTDMSYVKKQGINGPIWALIAFDCRKYNIPQNPDATDQVTREKLLSYILEKQLEDGGWALSGTKADPDMTGMAVQALAPYYKTDSNIKTAIDKAIDCMSALQYENGGFGSIDGICSESSAQIVVALTALGINPETDERFVKNGISVLDAICLFSVESGGFAHVPNGELNGMATEQSQYALVSYFRFLEGKTSLYDMTDVKIGSEDTPEYLLGDVTGDGVIDTTDYLKIKSHFLHITSLKETELKAGDADKSGTIDSTDYLLIKAHFLGIKNLES